ncbi:MAG: hypothetical protein AAGE38_07320 [Pseudomonadota bacterium]
MEHWTAASTVARRGSQGFVIALISLVLVLSLPSAGMPQEFGDLPDISEPGSFPPSAEGRAWLAVTEPGFYSVGLDGPGLITVSKFRTADGRSDGSDAVDELARSGSPFVAGRVDDLLLEPGVSYLLRTGFNEPRRIVLEQIAPVERAQARRVSAGGTIALTPGTSTLIEVDAAARLSIEAPEQPLKIEALSTPGAGVSVSINKLGVGAGGLFPVRIDEGSELVLDGAPGPDGAAPLVLLRTSRAPDNIDHIEPGPLVLGRLSAEGAELSAVFNAPSDRDIFEFEIAQPARYDLDVFADTEESMLVRLQRTGDRGMVEVLRQTTETGHVRRAHLTLAPGSYSLSAEVRTPRPVAYDVLLRPSRGDDPLFAGEPDDVPEVARPMELGRGLVGNLSAQDQDYLSFVITQPDRLWDIRAVQGVSSLLLTHAAGGNIGQWNALGGAVVVPLALAPGRYLMRLRGTGRYAVRIADAGPLPPGFEVEPNDEDVTAQRLRIGDTIQGDFLLGGDVDTFEFTNAVPTPLTVRFQGPDDGPATADLISSDGYRQRASVSPEQGEIEYSAMFPAGRTVISLRQGQLGTSGRWRLSLDRAETVEDHEPAGIVAMPRDGVITGQIGGFDPMDRIFLPLPEGEGRAVVRCSGPINAPDFRTFGDDQRHLRPWPNSAAVLTYGAELGGALHLLVAAAGEAGTYTCQILFPPVDPELQTIEHAEEADDNAPTALTPGTMVTGQFPEGDERDILTVNADPDRLNGLLCRDSAGTTIDPGRLRVRGDNTLNDATRQDTLDDGTIVFIGQADTAGQLTVSRGDTSEGWSCALIPQTAFRTPADMGPSAEFTAMRDRVQDATADAIASYDPEAALRLLSGGRPNWLAGTQITDTLDVSMTVTGLDRPFRAFSQAGQQAALTLAIANSAERQEIQLSATPLADGWKLDPANHSLTIEAGETADVILQLSVPPMQSQVTEPAIQFEARSGAQRTRLITPVLLDPLAAERAPFRFWSAPDNLRGGLDPMRYQFGARVIEVDGQAVDEPGAEKLAFHHDGMAQHTALPANWRARQMVFRLAEAAPIAGMILHLRTSNSRSNWPDRVALELSADGTAWTPAFDVVPTASDKPQYFSLPAPIRATHARLIRFGCRGDPNCSGATLAEVGLVASPDWRFSDPVNITDAPLGGHVVYARQRGGTEDTEQIFGGSWNNGLVTPGPASWLLPQTDKRGTQVEGVIAFHENRAARIAALEWVGHQDDRPRPENARLYASINGVMGPWSLLGDLPAPAEGQLRARLDLDTPVWARAVKFVMERHPEENRALPDQLLIWEDPTAPPVHGLWEDDRPESGYEATVASTLPTAPDPAGGPSADQAVPLPLDRTTRSSVQLERNADWWRVTIPAGPPQQLRVRYPGSVPPDIASRLQRADGSQIKLARETSPLGELSLTAIVQPGDHLLEVYEPPRSVAILWDTSGSVGQFIPRTLAAVRLWAQSLSPGRDRLQLLPFGVDKMLLSAWAESPADVIPALIDLPTNGSSDSERALAIAAADLADEDGQRGIVVFTDAETSQSGLLWRELLSARPRVVALSIDTSDPQGERVMKDWAAINGGYFQRIIGLAGLADGMDLAAALFRAPKGYSIEVSAKALQEPEGTARLGLASVISDTSDAQQPNATGAIQIILDASGSMLQRMPDGQRRIAVAHDALSGLVRNTLPPGTPFAFRAFGLEVDACRSELIVPLGPLNPAAAEQAIREVPAINLAKTAIARSLALAAEDLAPFAPPRVVVLVTDGEETCDGDMDAEIARIQASGVDLRLTIVGFAIDDAGLAQTFSRWANAGGGQYLAAGDAAGLSAAISEAIEPRFALERLYLDGREEPAGVIGLGETQEVAAGRYRLTPLQTAAGGPVEVFLDPDAERILDYDTTAGLTKTAGEQQ